MFSMRFLFCLLASLPSFLCALDYPLPHQNRAQDHFGVSFNPFFPKVNPISGEYIEEECDLEVAGSCPLRATRFYHHFSRPSLLYACWQLNPETLIKANFEKSGFPFNVLIGDRAGGSILLDGRREKENTYFFEQKNHLSTTNTALGPPSGQTNPKNIKLTYFKNCEKKQAAHFQFIGKVVDGSGRRLEFHTPMHEWHKTIKYKEKLFGIFTKGKYEIGPEYWTPYHVLIDKEILPNGNVLHYDYETYFKIDDFPTFSRVKSITAKNASGTKTLGELHFSYPENDRHHTKQILMSGS